ncbi:MAG: tetratricopeptide repeat protein [Bacteroidota bacterium]
MKFYNFLIKYRFWLGLVSLLVGLILQFTGLGDIWAATIFYVLSFIAIFTHFFIGPLRLVQQPMEEGNFEEVEKIIELVWFPRLLFKPIRSTYYTLKGNLAMVKQDFDAAEKNLKKSNEIGNSLVDTESSNKLQLGLMALQKSNFKEAEKYIKSALQKGIADKESEAMAHLGMVQIYMNKREFRAAKEFFRRAKACKPKNDQVVSQIKDMEKYMSRVPG